MSERSYDCLVIGTGPAGQKAAIQAAKVGKRVAVIEEARQVGGSCVHHGTIPSKTLRHIAAHAGALRTDQDSFNLQTDGQLQIPKLLKRVSKVISAHNRYIKEQLDRNGVDHIHGRARFTAPRELLIQHVDGSTEELSAEVVIIATGSRPKDPDFADVDHEHILDSDSIVATAYLPERLVVAGAGVIAAEYASIFACLGSQVTMIGGYPRPLGFLDDELCERFVKRLRALGCVYLPEREIVSMRWDGLSQVETITAQGDRIVAEKALVAMGRRANVERLRIDRAGLELDARGVIPVDEHGATGVPGIYAVGDVVGPPALASTSLDQGRRAAAHAFGGRIGQCESFVPTGIYTIPEMSAVGLSEKQARLEHGEVLVGRACFDELARGQISGNTHGLLKMIADPAGERLLGVSIIGDGATELIHVGQLALTAAQPISCFVDNVFNFPTLAEAYRVAALDILERRRSPVEPSLVRQA